jgi:hypothetical protein
MTEIVLRESITTWAILIALLGYVCWLIYQNFWK